MTAPAPLTPANEPSDARVIWEPATLDYMPMGHPPAPDPAALTDEELAKEEAAHVHSAWGHCLLCERNWPCPPLRLIAALRDDEDDDGPPTLT